MKQIRLNVNLFFNVPDSYEVTDTETIENLSAVELTGGLGQWLATGVVSHESIESVDISDTEDFTDEDEEEYYADRQSSPER